MATTSQSPVDRLLTRPEAAERLGVKSQTLAIWHSCGRYNLPAIKVGRCIRYRESDLAAWLEQRTIHGGALGQTADVPQT